MSDLLMFAFGATAVFFTFILMFRLFGFRAQKPQDYVTVDPSLIFAPI